MSDNIQLSAEPRADSGKGASRRLRRADMVPAIVYGGKHDPVSISLPHNLFLHQLENDAIFTQLIDLKVGKLTEVVILRDLQRHPYKNKIQHADFFRVDAKKVIHIVVPIHAVNEDICVGVKMEGGLLTHATSEIEIMSLPGDLPEYLELDVADLHLGETLHLSDIKVPKGVEIVALTHGEDHDMAVMAVVKTRAEEIDEEAPEAPEMEEDVDEDDNDESKD